MNEIDRDFADLRLLSVFAALMRERSVTRAAASMGRGQPAVSHALRRLRMLFADPLFTREGRAMQPTARALALHAKIAPSLEALSGAVRAARQFDPANSAPTFRIGLTDDLQIVLLPAITSRLRANIPHARLIVRSTDYTRAFAMLDSGAVDTLIGHVETLPTTARTRTLRRIGYRLLCRRTQAKAWDLDRYCAADHILISSAGDLDGIVDETLRALGRSRRVQLALPLFGALPSLLSGTDLVATVPEHLARALESDILLSEALPFEGPSYTLALAWRLAVDQDPAERLFRSVITDVVKLLR